jgi:ketosteroid isomerase-like protein
VTSTIQEQRNRDLVREVYEALLAGDSTVFKDATLSDFEADVTPSVPWGGVHRGVEAILANVLPPLAAAIDFGSLRLISISADGDNVAALLTARSAGDEEIWLAEYWTLRDGKIGHLRAFYFDAQPIVSSLAAAVS